MLEIQCSILQQLRISTGREIVKYFRKQYEVDNIQYRRHDDGFSFGEIKRIKHSLTFQIYYLIIRT